MVYLYLQAKCKLNTGRYQFQEAVQDRMLGLNKLYQAVLGKGQKIEDIPPVEKLRGLKFG